MTIISVFRRTGAFLTQSAFPDDPGAFPQLRDYPVARRRPAASRSPVRSRR